VIFKPDMAQAILDGRKTQTRRPAKPGLPCTYRVGKTYAIQPGRGKHAVGRLLVTSVTLVPFMPMPEEDAHAEGFEHTDAFYERWESMYGFTKARDNVWRIEFTLA
jgi:hypothetical protein